MGTADGALGLLRSWLGTTESPPGSNRTWIGTAFGWNGVAWCAEAQSLALKRSGTAGLWSASCYVLIEQLRARGRWHGRTTPRPGMLAFYSSGPYPNGGAHVNMVESVSGSSMTCLGGNESDALRRGVRSVASAYGFGTPPYAAVPAPAPAPGPAPAPPPPKEIDMLAEFVYKLQGHDRSFVCDLQTQRFLVDPADRDLTVYHLATRGSPTPKPLPEISLTQARRWPVVNLDEPLKALGFRGPA